LSVYQNYNAKAYTSLSGDVVTTNDTLNKVISNFATGTNFGVNFDGLDDKIIINNSPQLNPTGAITVETWINASAWKNSISDGSIIAKDINAPNRGYILRCGNNGSIEFMISDGGTWKSASAPSILLTNRWYHIAGVYDGSNLMLYVNGEKVAYTPASSFSPSPTNLYIGESPTYNGRTFAGAIDEVRIWNIAKSTAAIQANMSTSYNGNELGLVAYYKLDEGLGNAVINDQTANSNSGTLTSFVLANAWVSGYELIQNDVTVLGLDAPNNLTAFTGASRVKVKVKNTGFNPISNIPVSYRTNNGVAVNDTIYATLQPNQVYTALFNKVEDLSALTTSTISARASLANDNDFTFDFSQTDFGSAALTSLRDGIFLSFNAFP
jgi:hypothetical protein